MARALITFSALVFAITLYGRIEFNSNSRVCVADFEDPQSSINSNARTKHVTAASEHPQWRVDLHTLGFPMAESALQSRRGLDKFNTVDYISDEVVVASFVTYEPAPVVQRREDPNRFRSYRLHAIFLDAYTGSVIKTLEWVIDSPSAGLFPASGGRFLFFSAERIILYSADWKPAKEFSFSQLGTALSSLGGIAESPSGKTLVIQFRRGASTRCLRIVTATLDFSESSCEDADLFTASDKGMASPGKLPEAIDNGESRSVGPIIRYDVTLPGTPIESHNSVMDPQKGTSARTVCSSCVGMLQFVNDEMIATYDTGQIGLMGRDGTRKVLRTLNPKEYWIDELGRPLRPSADGRRFVVALNASLLRIGSPIEIAMTTGDVPAGFPSLIEVYDVIENAWVYSLEIRKDQISQVWGIALSPNGEKMIVDSGGVIQSYALPSTSKNLGSAR